MITPREGRVTAPDGLAVVDKPAGMTSHDVVARVRRLAGTRKVGHAGTLDPMATGVLVLGVGKGTKLLGHLALHDKAYDAVIRLGQTSSTDDAEGELGEPVDATAADPLPVIATLTGEIDQVPTAVSAIKVGGVRAYKAARSGAPLELAARRVTVSRFDLLSRSDNAPFVDLEVAVECTTGTYVRALARDLGATLGVGGHLTRLRRTRSGPFTLAETTSLDEGFTVTPLAAAVRAAFPVRELTDAEAADLRFGRPLDPDGRNGPVGAFAGDEVLALLEDREGRAKPLVVFAPA